MSERIYYVICEDKCLFESMTKEQIIAAIAEATGTTPTDIDNAFITKLKEQNAQKNMKMWVGTKAEYNAITTKATDTVYIIREPGKPTLVDIPDIVTDYNALENKPNIPTIISSGTAEPSAATPGYNVQGSIYFKIIE